MNLLAPAQEVARCFNEDETVQHEFERLQFIRMLLGPAMPFTEKILGDLDWRQAQATCLQVRVIGLPLN